MKEMDMPFDVGSPIEGKDIKNLDKFFGFIECEIKTPNHIDRPLLVCDTPSVGPFSLSSDNVLAKGTFTGTFFSEELKLAKKYRYQITCIKGYSFERHNLFASYVEHFFTLKNVSKGYKRWFYKLMLNSLYGRFGMDLNSTRLELVPYDLNKREHEVLRIQNRFGKLNQALMDRGFIMTEVKNTREGRSSLAWPYTRFVGHVGVASAITSYSRSFMYPFMVDEAVAYTDTDSLFTSKKLKSVGSDLGQFKLEAEFVDAIFLGPKTYILKHPDGSFTRKMAGLPREQQSRFSFQDFEKCLRKGEHITIQYWDDVKGQQLSYRLEACDNTKREKVYWKDIWVNTKPVSVVNNVRPQPKTDMNPFPFRGL